MKRMTCLLIATVTFLLLMTMLISCGGGSVDGGVTYDCVSDSVTSSHWAKTYDTCSNTESGGYIQQTNDNGYILAGTVGFHSPPYESSFLITKLNSYGNVDWSKVLDRAGYGDEAFSVQQTIDGGYIVAGGSGSYVDFTDDNYVLIRLDASGNIIWQKLYSKGGPVGLTYDGGYVISGNLCVIKIDSTGNIQWQKSYSEMGGLIKQTKDGGYIVVQSNNAGIFNVNMSVNEMAAIKLDAGGGVLWGKRYIGEVTYWRFDFLHETTDGGYIFGGAATTAEGGGPLLFKLDSMGNIIWAKAATTGGGDIRSIQPTMDGGYIVAGDTVAFNYDFDKNIWVLKFNQDGDVVWQKTYGGTRYEHGGSIIETNEGEYVVSGDSVSFRDNYDLWVLKLRSDGTVSPTAPSYMGADTYAEVKDVPVSVYESNPLPSDCSVAVSDANFSNTDINITVKTQASD